MKHLSHEHGLVLKIADNGSHICHECGEPISGPFYLCEQECDYYLHQNCAELPIDTNLLPASINCSVHDHQLTLLPNLIHEKKERVCNICYEDMTTCETVYSCVECLFFAHTSCATSSKIQPSSLKIEKNHFSHEHLLVLKKAEKINTLTCSYKCNGCCEPISGPFYRCKEECDYYLHKVCAELPETMNHRIHPQHHLTLLAKAQPDALIIGGRDNAFRCQMCKEWHHFQRFVYNCSICSFNLDIICAIASHTIEDKCHMHPLTPVQRSSSFQCNICHTEENSVSYKCSICPFWVHQNCTFLPGTVKCIDHEHELTLLPLIPIEFHEKLGPNFFCDICYREMIAYETVYAYVGCLFFSHASCAISSRDENIVIDLKAKLLPMRKDWTSLISLIVRNDEGEENICSKLPEQIPNSNKILDCEINHFSHEQHRLHLLDSDEVCGKMCDACAEPISDPSYGCTQCAYFLHKCCIDLPEHISHPFHSEHDIKLFAQYPNELGMFDCSCCYQICNTFGYECVKCNFKIDLKCASLSGRIKHEAHKHTLSANSVTQFEKCSTCNYGRQFGLKCEACSLTLCLMCTMLPGVVKHRYCKCEGGFKLRYSPLKDYHTDYYCDLCEKALHLKRWFYHCGDCDQFSHTWCLMLNAGDSNIKFGKSYSLPEQHDHMLILTRFTYDYSNCKKCAASLNKGKAVGYKCATCPDFKIHLICL